MRLRCGAVDLVGQDQLSEHRPGVKAERARATIEDRHTEDVGGQQVAGELDALELQPDQPCEHMGERGLAHAGYVLDQQVAARDQAGQREAQFVPLAEDDVAGRLEQAICMVQGHCWRTVKLAGKR